MDMLGRWQWLCRLYVAQNPACTHAYALRNHTVASALLRELGHDMAAPVDIVMARILNVQRAQLPSFVMLPPPIAQLYRTGKHKASPPMPFSAYLPHGCCRQMCTGQSTASQLVRNINHRVGVRKAHSALQRCSSSASIAGTGQQGRQWSSAEPILGAN